MQITFVVEPVSGNGYLAKTGEPLSLCAEGATEEEATGKLRTMIRDEIRAGIRIKTMEITDEPNPWIESAGIFSLDDPIIQEWIAAMAENRRLEDAESDQP